jgi:hypothetical protein
MRLLDRRGGRLPEDLQRRLDAHRARGDEIVGRVLVEHQNGLFRQRSSTLPSAQALKDDDSLALSVLVATVASEVFLLDDLQASLTRRRLPYEREDVEMLAALAASQLGDLADWRRLQRARAAVAAAERYARDHGTEKVAGAIDGLKRTIAAHESSSDWTALGVRLRKLVPEEEASFDTSMLLADDPWAAKVRPVVERDHRDQGALLMLLGAATSSRPTKKWNNEARPLVGAGGESFLRFLLESAGEVESRETARYEFEGQTFVAMQWLADPSATIVRGSLWAAALAEDTGWLVPVATALFERAMRDEQIKVANAALYALGESPADDAVTVLARYAARVKDRRFTKGIERALAAAAGRRGVTPAQLRESLVPTFGLDADGTAETTIGSGAAIFELAPPASVALRWRSDDGKTLKSVPASIREQHGDELAAVKATVGEIRKELATQRLRLEALLADDRSWTLDEWQRHYLDHPLVQLFARRLIWRFDDVAAIPLERDGYLTVDGSTIDPPRASEVRLWHPIDEPAETVGAWRRLIRERELAQPFKQAFREVYYRAPAEEETGTYSNRFAAHIVRYPQAYALIKQRGWGVVALGPYDNDGGRQWRDFDEHGVRAEFWMEYADDEWGMSNLANLASTDQVRFYRSGEREPMPLAEVPEIVFSEAMRDVDLFVGVTSVAADPEWLDRGPQRFHEYWHQTSFGDLPESAVVRRELLQELLPSLRIAAACSIDDKYLVVRGKLCTYKIHLGSAAILMEPNDQFLCIVPKRSKKIDVFLPFPEDDRFSIILSKAFLLADDDKIKDETILAQIRRD